MSLIIYQTVVDFVSVNPDSTQNCYIYFSDWKHPNAFVPVSENRGLCDPNVSNSPSKAHWARQSLRSDVPTEVEYPSVVNV